MSFRPRTPTTPPRPASMPCPNCRRLISANAEQCIHCGYRKPRYTVRLPLLNDLINERLSFTDTLILACFVLYALSILLDLPGALSAVGGVFNLFSPSNQSLYKLGMGGLIPWSQGRWWTLLTANYLHGSLLHILFNMLWLRQIGHLVEELFGASRFIIIYTGAGLVGSILSAIAGTPLSVGASGAVFGLFGALIYYGRSRGGTFGSAIFRQMMIWAAIGFLFGLASGGVDNWGHLGGFLGGLGIAFFLGYQEKGRQRLGHHIGAFVTILFIALCFVMVFANFFRG